MAHDAIVALYDAHPLSAALILDEARSLGRSLEQLSPEHLFSLDQDHYGGAAATEALALEVGVTAGDAVLDLCSGLGGPARFVAWRFGCRVTGIDLTEPRVDDARTLTALVGLDDRVTFVQGDVTALPFSEGSFDVCLSQESFLHVGDKARLFAECRRVLRPGGRIGFSDWAAQPELSVDERARLIQTFSAHGLVDSERYVDELGSAGFERIEVDDLSAQWQPLLLDRLELLRSRRARIVARLGEEYFAQWEADYAFMVDLVQQGKLGGARFVASAL